MCPGTGFVINYSGTLGRFGLAIVLCQGRTIIGLCSVTVQDVPGVCTTAAHRLLGCANMALNMPQEKVSAYLIRVLILQKVRTGRYTYGFLCFNHCCTALVHVRRYMGGYLCMLFFH